MVYYFAFFYRRIGGSMFIHLHSKKLQGAGGSTPLPRSRGAGVRWTPLRSRSTDRGDRRESSSPCGVWGRATISRMGVLAAMVVGMMGVYGARLVRWQIEEGEYYGEMAAAERCTVCSEGLRGEIYDRNGVPMAVNKTAYRAVINKLFVGEGMLNDVVVRLNGAVEGCGARRKERFPVVLNGEGRFVFDGAMEEETEELRELYALDPQTDAEECMEVLAARHDCEGYSREEQLVIIGVRTDMTRMGYSRTQPYVFADALSETQMAYIAEKTAGENGALVEAYAQRTYINGTAAPHLVGVTGLISAEEYAEMADRGYGYTDTIGKSGIEAALESELRGAGGSMTYLLGEDGNPSVCDTVPAAPGNTVYLTIDTRLQYAAQQALAESVLQANSYAAEVGDAYMGADCGGAAAVVLNVKDFSVLCAVSYPVYDLAAYYDDYEQLVGNDALPLFDRAFMGALAPGSTFKPLVAAAALEEKKITPQTTITCEGVYTANGLRLWCMGYHGDENLRAAMTDSCNVYFAEVGRLLGIDYIDAYARRCGLGVRTGVEVPESAGTLAGPDYSSLMGSQWYSTYTSQAAIGQSDNQFTPLQLAAYAATLANNGTRLRTHTVDRIVSYTGDKTVYQSSAEVVDQLGVSDASLRAVQDAMYSAASSYPALSGFEIAVAGKTGTAENSGSDHANFICYAPYDNPEIAVAVMVEHGAKSTVAVTAARKILEAYFSLPQDSPAEE